MAHALVWYRNDLRIDDQPALQAALAQGYVPIPVYVHAPEEEGDWAPGAASDAWRRRSLHALTAALRKRGAQLTCVRGPTQQALEHLARNTQAEAIFWTRRYEPAIEQRDTALKRTLRRAGLHAESHNGALLVEPWEVATKAGDPYKVFTPFWKAARERMRAPRTWDAPERLPPVDIDAARLGAEAIDALLPPPSPAWDRTFWAHWTPGEAAARADLRAFGTRLRHYPALRGRPGDTGTSTLSMRLHFGEVSIQRVVADLTQHPDVPDEARAAFLRQLYWREFAHHLLHHFPHTTDHNLDPRFDDFDWVRDASQLAAWQAGMTGIPIVDAGMRQLRATGWMHNRVRMIVASFLTKHLRQHWLHGARWFWDTLVDADLANNTLGWQWVAGTGADAAPYFRIFNPLLQARRFDPDAAYVRAWVPELGTPGYPDPIIDLAQARKDALAAYARR